MLKLKKNYLCYLDLFAANTRYESISIFKLEILLPRLPLVPQLGGIIFIQDGKYF